MSVPMTTVDKPVPKPRRRPPPQAPAPQGEQSQSAKVPILPPSPRTPRSVRKKTEFAATTEEEGEAGALGVIQEPSDTLKTIDSRPRLPTPDCQLTASSSPQKPTDWEPNSTPSPPTSSLPEDNSGASSAIYSYADVPASNDDAEYTEVSHRKHLRQPPPIAKKRLSSSTSPAVGAEYNVTSHKLAEKIKTTPPPLPQEYSVLDRPEKSTQPMQEYEEIDISATRQPAHAPATGMGYSALDTNKISAEQSDKAKKEERIEKEKRRVSGVRTSSTSDEGSVPASPRDKPPQKPKPALLPKPKSSKVPPPLDSARLRRSASPRFTPSPSPSPSHNTHTPPEYEIVGQLTSSTNPEKLDSIDPGYEGIDIVKHSSAENRSSESRKSSTPPPSLPIRGYSTPPRSREGSSVPDRATTQSPTPPLPARLYTPSPPPSLRDSTDSSKLTDSSKFTTSVEEDPSASQQNSTVDSVEESQQPSSTPEKKKTPSSQRRRPPPPPGYTSLPRSSSPPPPFRPKQQGDYLSKSFTLGRQPPKWTVTTAEDEDDEEEETSPQKGKPSSGSPSLRSRFKNLFRGSSIHGSDTSRNSYKKKKKNNTNQVPAASSPIIDTKARSQTLPIGGGGRDPFGLYSTVDGDSEEEEDDIKPALAYAIVDAKIVKRRSREPLARARINELRKSRSVEHLYDYSDTTLKSDSNTKSSPPGTPTGSTPPPVQSGELVSSICSEGSDWMHKSEEHSIKEEKEDSLTSSVETEKEVVKEEPVIEAPKRVIVDVPHELTESGAMYAVINKPTNEEKNKNTPIVQTLTESKQQSPVMKRPVAPAPRAPAPRAPARVQKTMKIIPSPPPESPSSHPPPVPSSSRPSAPPTSTPLTLKQPPKLTSRSKKASSKYAHLLTSPPPSHPPPLPPGQTQSNNIKNGTIPSPAHNEERRKSPRPHRPGSEKRKNRQIPLDQPNMNRNPSARSLSLDNEQDGPIYEPIPQGNGPPITTVTKPSSSASPKLRQLRPKTAPAPPPPNPRRQQSKDNLTNKADETSPQRLQNSQQSLRLRGELHSLSSTESTIGPPQFLFSAGRNFIEVGEPGVTVISPSISTSTVSSVMEHNDEDSDSTDWDASSREDDEEEEETIQKSVRPPKPKYYYIAQEMLTTERTFVKGLSLLHKDFRQHMLSANRAHEKTVVSEDILQQILSNIEGLFTLNTELLHELETRMKNWDSDPRIGDIFVRKAPFLKIYLQYISNFENAMKTLEDQQKRSQLFAQVLREFEAEPKCAHLPVAGYLLETVQRIPRYKLLLADYLKHLPEDSQDKESSEKALEIISSVATHVNETMRQMENFKKVVEVSKKLIGDVGDSLVTPHRRLLREGELTKSSRKEKQTRTFFLFTDLLVYTYAIPPANNTFKVIKRIPLDGMRVELLDDPEMRNGFQIISTCKSFRLDASSPEDRDKWLQTFETAIKDHKQRMFSRAAQNRKSVFIEHTEDDDNDVDSNPLGRLAPAWLPDNTVSMCQLCSIRFTVTRRRHHCRACGMIFCSECSSYLVPLPYKNNKMCRVCQTCYGQLATDGDEQLSPDRLRTTPRRAKPFRASAKKNVSMPSVLTEVKARDQNAQVSGYLMFSRERSRGWKKKWFVLYNMVLFEFKKHEDVCAQKSYPVPGYELKSAAPQDPLVFCLQHPAIGRYFFRADSEDHFQRWMDALDKAVKGENPS